MWSYHLRCTLEKLHKGVARQKRNTSGQTYIEVVVSLGVLMLVLPMVYNGLAVGQNIQKQGSAWVEATYKSEAMLDQVLKMTQIKGMPTETIGDLMTYLATSSYTKQWLESDYNTTNYRYDLAYIPTTYLKEEDVLASFDAEGCKYLTTEQATKEEVKQLFKEQGILFERGDTLPLQQGARLSIQVPITSLSYPQESFKIYSKDIGKERVYVTLGTQTNDTITYNVTCQESGDIEEHRKQHLWSTIILQLDARNLDDTSGKTIEVINETAFPVVVQSLTTGNNILEVRGKSKGGGRITTCINQQKEKENYVCLLLVTKKEGDTLKVMKKQMMAIPY